ncbi:MAG: DUF1553 domain-containing protein [Planctomycetes bacterium]|nr:DUF1553 domain-containing protein [Planctomycetota bacterium]
MNDKQTKTRPDSGWVPWSPGPAVLLLVIALVAPLSIGAAEPTAAQLEFFESRIRPVLIDQCYECHNTAKSAEGGLAVDQRSALIKGGDGGVIIVPGKPAESRLLAILRHEIEQIKMPQGGAKLDAQVIADFERWIAMGAPDPRDKPPTAEELTRATSWETVREKRKKWWSFQPIRPQPLPKVQHQDWSAHPIDQFVLARLEQQGLEPNPPADARTLVRRLFVVLIGLPPSAEDVQTWSARLQLPGGDRQLVDHLLASPRFGERWARHWMDWTRYADSHGSEGDPAIDNGWLYRDYLIRALNADVPFNQLLREVIAGDLLEHPRLNEALGINESMIGPAHWRMVFHGFAPTDALDEKVRFTDDAINTFTKAFLGMTVSCARCHDHKFDPISQKDYYALFGILGSCRPGRTPIDQAARLDTNRDKLTLLKPQIRAAIAEAWQESQANLKVSLLSADGPSKSADKPNLILNPLFVVRQEMNKGVSFSDAWQRQLTAWKSDRLQRDEHAKRDFWKRWSLTDDATYATWFRTGNGLPDKPQRPGGFSIATSGGDALAGIYPGGVYSHSLSTRHAARLSSGKIRLDDNYNLWVRVIGDGGAMARYVVDDYPRDGTVFPVATLANDWQWRMFDLTYWNGDEIHVELTHGRDAPLMVKGDPRAWFGIREVVIVRKGDPGPPAAPRESLDPVFDLAAGTPPQSIEDLADRYSQAVAAAVAAWRADSATDAQASLLDACLKQGVLTNTLEGLVTARPLINEYRRLEDEVVVPTRVPGLEETVGRDQALFERGNHKQPGPIVPRRFLEAIDATPYDTPISGRRQLAEDMLRPDNPLTRRVIVNRIWHHLFGRGIVQTPDNFGRLGSEPTHPELLDYLALRFEEQGWSIKSAIRDIVLSKTWQMSSRPSPQSLQRDADNRLLSHAMVRRMEAETIRDLLLSVSGSLSPDMYGGPTDGNSNRRGVYVRVTRNALDPFLRAFDFPEPFSAVGRRDVTNVPAQSLTLMNDERVASLAANWATRLLADPRSPSDTARIQSMFLTALGRPAEPDEVHRFTTFLAEIKARHGELVNQVALLRKQVDEQQTTVQKRLEPVRTRLLEQTRSRTAASEQVVPKPIGRWEFETDLQDIAGPAHGEARSGAKLDGGALVVKQDGHVITAPLKQSLKAKTLEAWVQLDNLDQRGGGVITIQTPDGVVFDAIVFGEQNPRQWMAGSNGFVRTQSFNAPQEQDAVGRAVHVAIAYHADGTIVGYRDGQPYGKPYKSNGPVEYVAGNAVVGFGIRHLPAGGNRMLAGKILRAQLYDRALSADEIQATSQSAPYFVSEAQVLAALDAADREQVEQSRKRIRELQTELEALGPVPDSFNDKSVWTELAHAMFTFQEFIYVK